MKHYKRTDGFEVQDSSDEKSVEQLCIEFGGLVEDWTDVTAQRDADALQAKMVAEQAKIDYANAKASAMAKLKALGLTDEEIASLI